MYSYVLAGLLDLHLYDAAFVECQVQCVHMFVCVSFMCTCVCVWGGGGGGGGGGGSNYHLMQLRNVHGSFLLIDHDELHSGGSRDKSGKKVLMRNWEGGRSIVVVFVQ